MNNVEVEVFDAPEHRRWEKESEVKIIEKTTFETWEAHDVVAFLYVLCYSAWRYSAGRAKYVHLVPQRLELNLECVNNKNNAIYSWLIGVSKKSDTHVFG